MTDQGAPDWFKAYTAAGGKPATGGATAPAALPAPAAGGGGGEDVAGYIRTAAQQRGIDPEVAIRVAQSEGGLVPNKTGVFKTGQSFWPFQLHYGGPGYERFGNVAGMGNSFTAQTGYQPGDPAAWKSATDYALDAAAKNGWGAWYGARNVGVTGYQGINRQANQTAAPPAQGNAGLARASEATPATTAPADAPDWFKGYAAAGGQTSAAAAPVARGGQAQGASSGGQPEWLQLAQTQLGKPYIWGSAGGRTNFDLNAPGYDCSGFVAQVYRNAFGVDIPAFTGNAYPATRAVAQQEAQPGDLVFWNMGTPDPRRQHVAIYIGDGKVIQSGGAGQGVNIAPVGQMPGAEFRRSPAAFARYATQGAPAQTPGTTAPAQPQGLALQGTVATPRASGAPGADAPEWFRGYVSAGGR